MNPHRCTECYVFKRKDGVHTCRVRPPRKAPTKRIRQNVAVSLTPTMARRISWIANVTKKTRAAVVRQLIREAFAARDKEKTA